MDQGAKVVSPMSKDRNVGSELPRNDSAGRDRYTLIGVILKVLLYGMLFVCIYI